MNMIREAVEVGIVTVIWLVIASLTFNAVSLAQQSFGGALFFSFLFVEYLVMTFVLCKVWDETLERIIKSHEESYASSETKQAVD